MSTATIRVPGLKVAVPLAAAALPPGLVPMDGPAGEPVLDLVLEGRAPLCPVLAQRLRETAVRAAEDERWTARHRLGSLSLRERTIIAKLIFGRSPAQIAREDVVAEATVRTQIKSILAKLEVSSQLGAVALARRAGWSTAYDLPAAS